jgi:hypothetical protein
MYMVTIRFVPVAKLLGQEAVALRVLARLRTFPPRPERPTARRPRPPPPRFLYYAEAIFRVGAADIVFFAESERHQLSAATEARLLSLLHSRAQAHEL